MSAVLPLDFSPLALFPYKDNANTSKKCIVIAKVIKEIAENTNMDGVTQEMLEKDAERKYREIERPRDWYPILHIEIQALAASLVVNGVHPNTAIEFYAFLIPKN